MVKVSFFMFLHRKRKVNAIVLQLISSTLHILLFLLFYYFCFLEHYNNQIDNVFF